MGIFSKLFGSYSKRELARIEPIKNKVLALDDEYKALSDAELKQKTFDFRERLETGEALESMIPEALATVREAAYRVLGKKPFPVQLIGAIVLHQGRIAEMKTGEGKTLVACVSAYLNALPGKGVHIVTVNDYLAKTQSDEMGMTNAVKLITAMLHMVQITNSDLTTCVTTWLSIKRTRFKENTTSLLSMRLTPFLSMKQELLLSFPVRATSLQLFMELLINSPRL